MPDELTGLFFGGEKVGDGDVVVGEFAVRTGKVDEVAYLTFDW